MVVLLGFRVRFDHPIFVCDCEGHGPGKFLNVPGMLSKRWMVGSICVTAFCGFWLLKQINPTSTTFFPQCPWYAITGLHCPGCGSTRAMHALLNGRWEQAFLYNPILLIVIPAVGHLVLSPQLRSRTWVATSSWTLLLSYAVIRNLPYWPFSVLSP
jgi:hypothetical protein